MTLFPLFTFDFFYWAPFIQLPEYESSESQYFFILYRCGGLCELRLRWFWGGWGGRLRPGINLRSQVLQQHTLACLKRALESQRGRAELRGIVPLFSGQVWESSDLDLMRPPVNSAPSSATPSRECLFDGVFHILGCLEESSRAAGYRTFLEPGQPLERRAHIGARRKKTLKLMSCSQTFTLDRTCIWGGIRETGRPSINTTYLPLPYSAYLFLSIKCSLCSLRIARTKKKKGKQKKVGRGGKEREGQVWSSAFVAPAAPRILRLCMSLRLCGCLSG